MMKLFLSIIIISLNNTKEKIILNFNRFNEKIKNTSNETTIKKIIKENLIIDFSTNLYLGNFKQKIKLFLSQNEYGLYLSDNKCPEFFKYNPKISTSYKQKYEILVNNNISYMISEALIFDNFLSKYSMLLRLDEYTINYPGETNENICGYFGLRLHALKSEQYKTNLETELKQRKIIDSYNFLIHVDSDDLIQILFGFEKEEYNINNISNATFVTISPIINKNKYLYWGLQFKAIIINKKKLDVNNCVTFNYNSGFIIAPIEIKIEIVEPFFKPLINTQKCFIEFYDFKYYIYYCDKTKINKNEIEKFPNFNFIHKELNFDFFLNYNDLFIEKENYFIFLIAFNKFRTDEFSFGLPFFKKYNFIYNRDTKSIGFFTFQNDINKVLDNNIKNIRGYSKIFKIILFIFLILLAFFGVLIYGIFLGKKKFGLRKKKVNELLELFQYGKD